MRHRRRGEGGVKEVQGMAVECETVKDERGEGVGDDVGEECEQGEACEQGGARAMRSPSNVLRCIYVCVCVCGRTD